METLDEALGKVWQKHRRYFRWKFKLPYKGQEYKDRPLEEIMKIDGIANISTYLAWEKTEEYHYLINLMLNGKSANDLLDIYEAVADKAKKGDSKAVDTLLKLQKTIQSNLRKGKIENQTVDEEDELEL